MCRLASASEGGDGGRCGGGSIQKAGKGVGVVGETCISQNVGEQVEYSKQILCF